MMSLTNLLNCNSVSTNHPLCLRRSQTALTWISPKIMQLNWIANNICRHLGKSCELNVDWKDPSGRRMDGGSTDGSRLMGVGWWGSADGGRLMGFKWWSFKGWEVVGWRGGSRGWIATLLSSCSDAVLCNTQKYCKCRVGPMMEYEKGQDTRMS